MLNVATPAATARVLIAALFDLNCTVPTALFGAAPSQSDQPQNL
ncbi:hypothetical protein ACSW29_02620 [Rhodococcus sp. GB-02]